MPPKKGPAAPVQPSSEINVVHLSVECPGGTGPLVGKPCLGSAGGLYELGFEAKFRQDASEEGLWQLLNSEVVLQLLDSATGLLLGSAPLDLLPLGLGEQSFQLSDLLLQTHLPPPLPPSAAPGQAAGATAAAKAAAAAAAVAAAAAAAAAALPVVRLVGEVTLPSVQVTLMQRQPPPEGTPEAAAVEAALAEATAAAAAASAAAASAAPGSKPGTPLPNDRPGSHRASGPTAAALVDEALLPALEPYRYLPACGAQPHQLNVVELRVWGPGGAVPAAIMAAQDISAAKLSLSACLALPSPGPCLKLSGAQTASPRPPACPAMVLVLAAGGSLVTEGAPPAPPAANMLQPPDSSGPTATRPGPSPPAGSSRPTSGSSHATPDPVPACTLWPRSGRLRHVLTPQAAQELMTVLEDSPGSLGLELARHLGDDPKLTDLPAVAAAYHAWAPLPGAQALLEAGARCLPAGGPGPAPLAAPPIPALALALAPWGAAAGATDPPRPSGLPALPSAPSKLKPIEELGPEALAAGAQYSAWAAAGSRLLVSLSLARPLVPAWDPPPAPPLEPHTPCAHQRPAPPCPPAHPQAAAANPEGEGEGVEGGEGRGAAADPLLRHRVLVRQLNASGTYLELRQRLKEPLMDLARQQLGLGQQEVLGPANIARLAAPLHGAAGQALHAALAAMAQPAAAPAPPPPKPDPLATYEGGLPQLVQRALESEAVGDRRRAHALLRRCSHLAPDSPEQHLQAAILMARAAADAGLAPAQAAVAAALEIDPRHPPALAAAAALSLEQLLAAGPPPPPSSQPSAYTTATATATTTASAGQAAKAELAAGGKGPGAATKGGLGGDPLALGLAAGHALLEVLGGASEAWALLACLYAADDLPNTQLAPPPATRPDSADQAGCLPPPAPSPPAPWQAAGLLPLWRLLLQLGLPAACRALLTATLTTFRRSSAPPDPVAAAATSAAGLPALSLPHGVTPSPGEPAALLLLARTALLLAGRSPGINPPAAAAAADPDPCGRAELVEGSGGAEQGRRRRQWLRVAGLALRLAHRCPALPRLDCLMLRGDLAWEQAADATATPPLHPPPTHSHPADDSSPYPLSTLTTTTTTSSVSPPVFSASSLLAQARDAYQAAVLLQLHSQPPAPAPGPPPSPSHPAARDPDPTSAGPLTDSTGLPPAVPPALLLPGSEEGEGRAWLLRGGLRAVALYLQAGQAEAAGALAGNLAALMPE
ncbi:hypothetical protein V8C86DRAFT_3176120 [Haematococcus lacustris]